MDIRKDNRENLLLLKVKFTILLLLISYSFSCNRVNRNTDITDTIPDPEIAKSIVCKKAPLSLSLYQDSTLQITPLPVIDGYYDRKPFQFFSQYNSDFRTFLCIMYQADSSISSFEYDSVQKALKIIANDDSSLTNKNFFYRTHDHETSFYYYRYFDLYKSLFRFAEVDNIEIWVAGKNKTFLPLEGDAGFLLPRGMMKRKWLVPEEKYDELFSGKDAFGFTYSTDKVLSMELRETFMDSVADFISGKIHWK